MPSVVHSHTLSQLRQRQRRCRASRAQSSHVSLISHPQEIADLVLQAAGQRA